MFAACASQIFSIELTRGYNTNEFREDLKKLYRTAGIDGEPVVFLFSDSQASLTQRLKDVARNTSLLRPSHGCPSIVSCAPSLLFLECILAGSLSSVSTSHTSQLSC